MVQASIWSCPAPSSWYWNPAWAWCEWYLHPTSFWGWSSSQRCPSPEPGSELLAPPGRQCLRALVIESARFQPGESSHPMPKICPSHPFEAPPKPTMPSSSSSKCWEAPCRLREQGQGVLFSKTQANSSTEAPSKEPQSLRKTRDLYLSWLKTCQTPLKTATV